jgi:TPR repeat protein
MINIIFINYFFFIKKFNESIYQLAIQGDSEAQFKLGQYYYSTKNYNKGIYWY